MVANGVVAAAKNLGVSIPIVARLEGTNVEEGRRVLHDSDIGIIPATTNERRRRKKSSRPRTPSSDQISRSIVFPPTLPMRAIEATDQYNPPANDADKS
jgi:hypothetical protein